MLRRSKVQDIHQLPLAKSLNDVLWAMWTERGMPKEGPVFVSAIGKPYTRDRVRSSLCV